MKLISLIVSLIVTGIPLVCFSQDLCPAGQQAVIQGGVVAGCIPGADGGERRPRATGEWRSSWGAAAKFDDGRFIMVVDESSKRKAERRAAKECKDAGGQGCKVIFVIGNQCGVLVGADGTTNLAWGRGSTEREAEAQGMTACSEAGGGGCAVRWSGCSNAKFVNY